ncbi:MAG: formylglycine-generating enzyme family protein, partial [Planctomycetales bacterium]
TATSDVPASNALPSNAARQAESSSLPTGGSANANSTVLSDGMVMIPGGRFQMGDDDSPHAAERPAHEVRISPFWLDVHEMTCREFARFVAATNHRTDAERQGWAPVLDAARNEWTSVEGADWRFPLGPSAAAAKDDHPVTQVSWNDAAAYARWVGKRLPTEAEWEFAASQGALESSPRTRANLREGPTDQPDPGGDGFRGPAPVGSFPQNALGLRDLSGNVREWCGDWFAEDYYRRGRDVNPRGPATGTHRARRGGSWLASPDVPPGVGPRVRGRARPGATAPDAGFRCARDSK